MEGKKTGGHGELTLASSSRSLVIMGDRIQRLLVHEGGGIEGREWAAAMGGREEEGVMGSRLPLPAVASTPLLNSTARCGRHA
jgi:hypothetical protein